MKTKIIKTIVLAAMAYILMACPAAKLTSIFIRNYTDAPVTISLSGETNTLFEDGKEATSINKLLKNRKLKTGNCAQGDTVCIKLINNTNQLTVAPNSTTEIIFPMYKILQISSSLSIETESNGLKKNYFSNQFNEVIKSKKDIFYIDLKNEN
jgi:hypothetical protein